MNRTTSCRAWPRHIPAIMAGLVLPLAGSALAGPATTDRVITRTLAHAPVSGWSSVILKVKAPLTPAQEVQVHSLGGDLYRRLPIIGSVAVRVPSRNLEKLAALPFVTHLSLDGTVKKSDEFTVGSSEADLAMGMGTGKKPKPYQLTGSGVTVAVLDSGITPAADLSSQSGDIYNRAASRILANVNFSNAISNGATTLTLGGGSLLSLGSGANKLTLGGSSLLSTSNNGNSYDPCGHGTHVAGIIAGNGSRSPAPYCTHTFEGIAPQSNLVNVRVLDQNGSTSVSTVISGLQWVITNKAKYNIRVINLSLGHPVSESYTTDPLCQAVEAAYQAGIVVVCAAGNDGRVNTANDPTQDNEGWGSNYGSIHSPANDPYVITVGATKNMDGVRADDRIATYSSRGPSRLDLVMKPDIIAPGNKVISLDAGGSMLDTYAGGTNQIPYSSYVGSNPLNKLGLSGNSGDYFQISGTSMAAPVVAGAAALLLQANPSLTPDTIKARLMLSADKWADPDGTGDALTYGAGYLNIPAALASKVVAQGAAISPSVAIDSANNVSLVMDRAVWGSSLWGTGVTDLRCVWGSRAVWGSNGITDSRAVWGSNAIAASRCVWGSSVWADRAVWGSASSAVDLTSTAITGE